MIKLYFANREDYYPTVLTLSASFIYRLPPLYLKFDKLHKDYFMITANPPEHSFYILYAGSFYLQI